MSLTAVMGIKSKKKNKKKQQKIIYYMSPNLYVQ